MCEAIPILVQLEEVEFWTQVEGVQHKEYTEELILGSLFFCQEGWRLLFC